MPRTPISANYLRLADRRFRIALPGCAALSPVRRTNLITFVLARDEAALAAKCRKLAVPAQFYGVAGTVPQVSDLVGRYRDAGVQLLISSAYKNDAETLELLAADVMPAFAG